MDLLENDSDSVIDFTINENYARGYEKWRRGEEIQKLKDKYGNVEDSSESTSEEEDENGKELTEDVEKQFYKTLSCLKEKNPKIYDQSVRFFEEKSQDEEVIKLKTENRKQEAALSLAGYQRKVLLETDGQFSDEEIDEKSFEMLSSQEQENDIKQSFKDVLKDSDNEDEEQWGNLFTKRIKSAEEIKKEEEDFRLWLGGGKNLKDLGVKEELKGLHDYWTDPKLDEGERFLRDYVLNKRYLEQEDKKKIPLYDEIVHDSDSNLSADGDTLNQQEEFEKKYNFRFEEPDHEFIKRYPRTLDQSMRKKDDKRKTHRVELKQRKQVERSKKDEELKRLKVLKKKEIMDKIKKLQQITGNEDIAFQREDLEGDFDPQKYDKRMSQIFNEDYYGTEGDDKYPGIPEFAVEDLETENWDDWVGHEEKEEDELHCEDPDFNMDCDYDPTKNELQEELIHNSRRRKKKKKSKFAESLEREKPVFDPEDKTFEEYINEYYALDYEDLIGDLPCRFKYRKVVPNDYGLSIEEILNATDKELNRWVSMKKIRKRLPEHIEKYDVKAYKLKALDFEKKAKCFPSLYGPQHGDCELPEGEMSQKFKSQGKDSDYVSQPVSVDTKEPIIIVENESQQKKKRNKESVTLDIEPSLRSGKANAKTKSERNEKKKRKMKDDEVGESLNNDEAIKGETSVNGIRVLGKKNKIENGWITETVENDEPLKTDVDIENGTGKRKRRRRKKPKQVNSQGSGKDSVDLNLISVSEIGKKRKRGNIESKGSQKWSIEEGKRHKMRKMNHHQKNNDLCGLSDERLRSYGLNPKKYRNKLKYKTKNKQ